MVSNDFYEVFACKDAAELRSDVHTLFEAYEDVLEKVKIVTLGDIRAKDYTLAINNYIEKKEAKTTPPSEIRRQYFEAYEDMLAAEERMRRLLVEGGYVNE